MVANSCLRSFRLWLRLHRAIYLPDSAVLLLRYCANFKAIRDELTSLNRILAYKSHRVIVAYAETTLKEVFNLPNKFFIYLPDSTVLLLRYCANFKAIRNESTSLNRIVANKSHRVIVAYAKTTLKEVFNLPNKFSFIFTPEKVYFLKGAVGSADLKISKSPLLSSYHHNFSDTEPIYTNKNVLCNLY